MSHLMTTANFCKPGQFNKIYCTIMKVIRLDGDTFDHFINHPAYNYDFISNNLKKMDFLIEEEDEFGKVKVADCILVVGDGRSDGVAVYQENEDIFSRSVALLPNATIYLNYENQKAAEILTEYLLDKKFENQFKKFTLNLKEIYKDTLIDVECDSEVLRLTQKKMQEKGLDPQFEVTDGMLQCSENLRFVVAEFGKEASIHYTDSTGSLNFAAENIGTGLSGVMGMPMCIGDSREENAMAYYSFHFNDGSNEYKPNRLLGDRAIRGTLVLTGLGVNTFEYQSLTEEQAKEFLEILNSPECFISKEPEQKVESPASYKALEELQKKLHSVVDYITSQYTQTNENVFFLELEKVYIATGVNLEFNTDLLDTVLDMLEERPEFTNAELQIEDSNLAVYSDHVNTHFMQ